MDSEWCPERVGSRSLSVFRKGGVWNRLRVDNRSRPRVVPRFEAHGIEPQHTPWRRNTFVDLSHANVYGVESEANAPNPPYVRDK